MALPTRTVQSCSHTKADPRRDPTSPGVLLFLAALMTAVKPLADVAAYDAGGDRRQELIQCSHIPTSSLLPVWIGQHGHYNRIRQNAQRSILPPSFHRRLRSSAAPQARRNSARFAATTVAPTGVDHTKDTVSPTQKHPTDVQAAQRVTPGSCGRSAWPSAPGKSPGRRSAWPPSSACLRRWSRPSGWPAGRCTAPPSSPWPGRSSRRR